MKRDDLKRLIQGAIATVPTPFDDGFELDLGRMAELTRWWVDSGLVTGKSAIKVAAAMGEGYQLRETEWPPLLRTVVQAAAGRVPVICGIHYKDTIRAIEDARKAQDLGAVGLQVSPPILNDPSQDDILRFYEALSDSIGIGIIVYNTFWMPHGAIDIDTFRKMADFEQVVAVKWQPQEGVRYEEIFELAHVFNIIDNRLYPVRCHKMGGRGFINQTAEVYPPHDLRVWELLESRQYDEAQALWDSVDPQLGEFYLKITRRSGGGGRLKKAMMAIMGRPIGESRPPSQPLNNQEMTELRELMIGWGWPVP